MQSLIDSITPKVSDEALIAELLRRLGENPDRSGLVETPARVIKALRFMTSGYIQSPEEVLKCFEDGAEGCDQMVLQRNIAIYSMCEHHMVPFFGRAHIAYIPNKKIVGLSKLARVADIYARRLQVQERLTNQIADALQLHLKPHGVGVVLECRHLCMECRGVEKTGTVTVTSALRGAIREEESARAEFLSFTHSKPWEG
jgi:GTP cyclohydrolase I